MNTEGKTVLVTGSTDGIGKQTAKKLAQDKAHVCIHGRDEEKAEQVTREIQKETENSNIEYFTADLSSLENVRRLGDEILEKHDRLDVLINNAGLGGEKERQTSEEGYELLFAVNYLSHFLLTNLLMPALQQAAPARIVNVSSGAQDPIDFEDVMLEEEYNPGRAYGQSKLAMAMFTVELAERLRNRGEKITVNSLHPGTFLNTKMVRKAGHTPRGEPEEGADAIFYLAVSDELNNVSGKYFDRKREAKAHSMAYDPEARKKLWEISEKYTGLK